MVRDLPACSPWPMAERHGLSELDIRDRGRFVAACTCGWVTEAMTTAGLAQACLDGHVGEVEAPGPEAPQVEVRPWLAPPLAHLGASAPNQSRQTTVASSRSSPPDASSTRPDRSRTT